MDRGVCRFIQYSCVLRLSALLAVRQRSRHRKVCRAHFGVGQCGLADAGQRIAAGWPGAKRATASLPLATPALRESPIQYAPTKPAVEVVATALLLRRTQPELPAVAVLDQAMQGRIGRRVDFGSLASIPSPFALLVAEAFDGGMLPSDWEGLWRFNPQARLRKLLSDIWAYEVWPKFAARYCQWGPVDTA